MLPKKVKSNGLIYFNYINTFLEKREKCIPSYWSSTVMNNITVFVFKP